LFIIVAISFVSTAVLEWNDHRSTNRAQV
jgi:hypothetical protein